MSHPRLLGIPRKLADARQEVEEMERSLRLDPFGPGSSIPAWLASRGLSAGVQHVYTGIEDAMMVVLREVDGDVPIGEASHQEVLDRLSVEAPGLRPALLSEDLRLDLGELKRFRHMARHSYGFRMDVDPLLRNVRLAIDVMGHVEAAMLEFDRLMSEPQDETPSPP